MKELWESAQKNPGQALVAVAAVVVAVDQFKESTKKSREENERLIEEIEAFNAAGKALAASGAGKKVASK